MPVSVEELRPYLQDFDFPRLFVEGLGWDHYQAQPLALPIDGQEYALKPVAEKANFAVFECGPGHDGVIPEYPIRRKIESEVAKRAFEHLIIFTDPSRNAQVWQWVRRESGKPAACREYPFSSRPDRPPPTPPATRLHARRRSHGHCCLGRDGPRSSGLRRRESHQAILRPLQHGVDRFWGLH